MLQEKVEELLHAALAAHPSLFLIDLNIDSDHRITIIIDGDQGVTVEDCMAISRAVEHNLDRETEDFAIDVMSAGVTEPLVHPRQYLKNVSRELKIKKHDGAEVKGTLESADDNGVTLVWKAREPKPVGKGKVTVEKNETVRYTDIKKANVMVNFNSKS